MCPAKFTPERELDIVTLYQEGNTLDTIVAKIKETYDEDIAPASVYRVLSRNKIIKNRQRGDQRKVFAFLDKGESYPSVKSLALTCNVPIKVAYVAHARWKRAKRMHTSKL